MKKYTDDEIKKAVLDAEIGLFKYEEIIKLFNDNKVDVSTDINFQRKFNDFFSMGRRSKNYYIEYFVYFKSLRDESDIFSNVLEIFYKKIHRVEASFISKMLHVIDNNLPIYDKNVLHILEIERPKIWWIAKRKIEKASEIYNQLIQWYKDFEPSSDGQKWISFFNEKYPKTNISSTKKIDFILWRLGAG